MTYLQLIITLPQNLHFPDPAQPLNTFMPTAKLQLTKQSTCRTCCCCCCCSVEKLCLTLCIPTDCSTPGFPVHHNFWSLLKRMSFKSVMPSTHLILCRPLLLPLIFPSIRVFSNESALHIRWPKYWKFSSASVFPMNIQG